ncbi:MAG: phosphate/phosphite/phosphonate ABC transporter substrate-binding protein, partial [Pseudomonadota bacterium]|jgi:phosphonate transport system substrate-binding protein
MILTPACAPEKEPLPESPAQVKYSRILLIGLMPEQNVFKQMEKYEPLAQYISRKTGIGIELKILSRYGNIIDNFESLGLDGAFFGSFTYALAHTRFDLQTAVRPESPEGVSSYYGMIFVRSDSGITSVKQMKGRRFAFVDKATTAGYLLPLKYFRDNGIEDYKKYLSEVYFTGTHEDAILDVLNKRADIGAAKDTVFRRVARSNPAVLAELTILARSPRVPENALAFRSDIDPDTRANLKKAFLEMSDDPEGIRVLKVFGAARFIETTNEDYRPVFEYAKAAGLDLATYDWTNE